MTLRVLVCGGRDYADWPTLSDHLWSFHHDEGFFEVIHGGARGADEMAGRWARMTGIPEFVFKADWDTHGKAAGSLRNQQMLDEGKPNIVLAFPGGRGTADMIRRAEAAGITVRQL